MHINAVCPQCKNRYQVDPVLRGKKMRCPDPKCRTVFDVVDGNGPPPGASKPGHVSDFVPLEQAQNEGPNLGDWRSGPPPRGAAGSPPAKPAPPPREQAIKPARPAKPPKQSEPPPEPGNSAAVADWHAAPPPVARPNQASDREDDDNVPTLAIQEEAPRRKKRGGSKKDNITADPPEPAYSELDLEDAIRLKKKRRARRLMIGMVVGLLLVFGVGGYIAFTMIVETEEKQAKQAQELYAEARYSEASKKFRDLAKKFKDSKDKPRYEFLATLSDMRQSLGDEGLELKAALDQFQKFLESDAKGTAAFLKEFGRDIGDTFFKRLKAYLDKNAGSEDPKLREELTRIEQATDRVNRLLAEALTGEQNQQLQQSAEALRAQIALSERLKGVLAKVEGIAKPGDADALRALRDYVRRNADSLPKLNDDGTVKSAIEDIQKAMLANAKYVPADPAEKPPALNRAEDTEPSILIDPPLGPVRNASPNSPIVAVFRGVLYVLDPVDGRVQWALRVGIDTTQLPLRLPPAGGVEERLLVLSADTQTLSAYGLTSQKRLWQYHLGSTCLGKPLVVERFVYLPTVDGKVHEVYLEDGRLKGRFHLGQRLSTGGTYHQGTRRLYFPGDDSCVYVLDKTDKEQKCELILFTNHAAGSLRGEPIILNEEGGEPGGKGAYLALAVATGINETQLKLYPLPLSDKNTEPLSLKRPAQLGGWTWFAPSADGEKVVCLSDSGQLGLFGIKQARHNDELMFPLVAERADAGAQKSESSSLDVSEFLGGYNEARRGRALVAHVQGDELWLLALGRLQRMELRFDRLRGPELFPRWRTNPLQLGSPLLPAQLREGPEGLSLILVTQPTGRPECVVTSIDPEAREKPAGEKGVEDPRVRWKRQLGMVCHGQPLLVGDQVVAMDRAGGFYRFDPAKFKSDDRWQIGGEVLESGIEAGDPPQLLEGGAGKVYSISIPGGDRLLVRRLDAVAGGAPTVTKMAEVQLPARVAGNVILLGETLVVPLDNGKLVRLTLPLTERTTVEDGPTWRSRWAVRDAVCRLVALGDDEFLSTDGNRGVAQRFWKGSNNFGERAAKQLEDRLVGAVLALARATPKGAKVVVADQKGVVRQLGGEGLDIERTWSLGGAITAGPFLRDGKVGVVVDKTRLVWIDPATDEKPLWEHKAEDAIVGEPVEIQGSVVVADAGGKFVGLDRQTGKSPDGVEGYTLKALVAPATTPVSFGKDRAFAPLTDGTIMVLSLDRLRKK